MTIRAYCDAAYALILGEYQRVGIALDDALERLADWAASAGRTVVEREEERLARQNEAELLRFQEMMGSLGA